MKTHKSNKQKLISFNSKDTKKRTSPPLVITDQVKRSPLSKYQLPNTKNETYFVYFSGSTGMAPCWVHTYALTSTANL